MLKKLFINKLNSKAAIFLAFFVYAYPAFAQSGGEKALSGLEAAANAGFGGNAGGSGPAINSLPTAIGTVVGTALSFVGAIFLILMIYGGFKWMFARGNEQEVGKAKDLIVAAIIGLLIILSAYAITAYIGGALL